MDCTRNVINVDQEEKGTYSILPYRTQENTGISTRKKYLQYTDIMKTMRQALNHAVPQRACVCILRVRERYDDELYSVHVSYFLFGARTQRAW